jgi:hypothetical protein
MKKKINCFASVAFIFPLFLVCGCLVLFHDRKDGGRRIVAKDPDA